MVESSKRDAATSGNLESSSPPRKIQKVSSTNSIETSDDKSAARCHIEDTIHAVDPAHGESACAEYTGFSNVEEFRQTSLSYPVLKAACVLKQATDFKPSVVLEVLVDRELDFWKTKPIYPSEYPVAMAIFEMMDEFHESRSLNYEALQSRQKAGVVEFEKVFNLSMKASINLQYLQIPMIVRNKDLDPKESRFERYSRALQIVRQAVYMAVPSRWMFDSEDKSRKLLGQATPVEIPLVEATPIPETLPAKKFMLEWKLTNINDKARIEEHFREIESYVTFEPLRPALRQVSQYDPRQCHDEKLWRDCVRLQFNCLERLLDIRSISAFVKRANSDDVEYATWGGSLGEEIPWARFRQMMCDEDVDRIVLTFDPRDESDDLWEFGSAAPTVQQLVDAKIIDPIDVSDQPAVEASDDAVTSLVIR